MGDLVVSVTLVYYPSMWALILKNKLFSAIILTIMPFESRNLNEESLWCLCRSSMEIGIVIEIYLFKGFN